MNWEDYVSRFGAGSFIMGTIIESTTAHFSTEFDLLQVKDFFKPRRGQVGSGRRKLDQSLEHIKINIAWRANHEEDVKEWIRNKFGGDDDGGPGDVLFAASDS